MQRTPSAPLMRKPLGRREVAVLAVASFCLVTSPACCDSPWYTGDGTVVSQGLGSKFELDLGSIDATKSLRQSYRMAGFTPHDLVVGFRVTGKRPDMQIRVSLTNSRGEAVIQEQATLSDWVWSYAASQPDSYFVYRRGLSRDVPIGNGAVTIQQVGVRADGGWGTYFHPRRNERYALLIEVIEPSNAPATLKAVVKCAEIYTP
jgi:hypothetical protein